MPRSKADRPDQPNAASRFNEEAQTYTVRGAGTLPPFLLLVQVTSASPESGLKRTPAMPTVTELGGNGSKMSSAALRKSSSCASLTTRRCVTRSAVVWAAEIGRAHV